MHDSELILLTIYGDEKKKSSPQEEVKGTKCRKDRMGDRERDIEDILTNTETDNKCDRSLASPTFNHK